MQQKQENNLMDDIPIYLNLFTRKKAADQFNDANWIPDSLVLPELHEDFS